VEKRSPARKSPTPDQTGEHGCEQFEGRSPELIEQVHVLFLLGDKLAYLNK
jgi:hypothetical protein